MTTIHSHVSRITLPTDLIRRITLNLRLKEVATCLSVCKLWFQALSDSDEFWEHLCARHFSVMDPLTTNYKQLYRQLHKIRSSLLINPEPITLKGLKTHNPQITCIYEGKTGKTPEFKPIGEIRWGSAIKNLYQKMSTQKPEKMETWVGKVGSPGEVLRTDPNPDSRTGRTRSKIEMGIDTLREKLASDLYQELGRGLFLVPKTRISSQPILNPLYRVEL